MSREWNHNIQYHGLVLSAIPSFCDEGLDVGCGDGLLTQKLAARCRRVTGIDLDARVIAAARGTVPEPGNVSFIAGDVMGYPFPPVSFHFIAAVASLHHLPLEAALLRFRGLLAPGGVLIVIGLYREDGPADALYAGAGLLASWMIKRVRRFGEIAAPMRRPQETLPEIRKAAAGVLPGSVVRRRLLFRYSLLWRKP